jgi:hypothetical protein
MMLNETVKLTLKGAEYTFTALDFEQLQQVEKDFEAIADLRQNALPSREQRDAIVHVVRTALSAAHPELTDADVAKLVTLATIGPCMAAVAGVSGLEKASGEA